MTRATDPDYQGEVGLLLPNWGKKVDPRGFF